MQMLMILIQEGGGGLKVLGHFLKAVVQAVFLDMGPDPLDGAGPEQFSAQGRATDHREADKTDGVLVTRLYPRYLKDVTVSNGSP